MKYRPYPTYKDSGVEWVEAVPEHWEVKPTYAICELSNGFPFDSKRFQQAGVQSDRLIRIRDLQGDDQIIYTDEMCPTSAIVRDGDLLVGMDGDFNIHHWWRGAAKLNQRVCVLRTGTAITARYLLYSLKTPLQVINDLTYATTVKHITSHQILHAPIAVPPQDELELVVSVLDRETTRIDTLITKKTRFIELLQEKRQALITRTVTKGLDPSVPMKDSGVAWIGEVPEHWEMLRTRHVATSFGGGTPDKSNLDYWGGPISWVTPKDMKHEIVEGSQDTITAAGYAASPTVLIKSGAVLIVFRSGVLRHTIPVAINACEVVVNQDIRAFRFEREERMLPQFFLRFVQGLNDALIVFWCKQGATVESIEADRLDSSLLPVPPLSEQRHIVDYLEVHTTRIDTLITKTQRSIELLQERRSALITAAVTGQIDLREAA